MEKPFGKVPREVGRWVDRRLGMDQSIIMILRQWTQLLRSRVKVNLTYCQEFQLTVDIPGTYIKGLPPVLSHLFVISEVLLNYF